jgi:threonine dehydrogenase-like Zn-dependent dehydrogenase
MKAVVWHGRHDVRVESVPDPSIQEPTDAIVRLTSSGLCGSDLHLYEVLAPFMSPGDILGHEPMGIVEAVGPGVQNLRPGDRVVVPFNIACGSCFMCEQGLQSQCETTQNHDWGTGASLFGYSKLYGQVPGAQAEYLRVPHADYGPIVVPAGPPDDRFVYLSDVLPTGWQAVRYAGAPGIDSLAVLGLGPIGDMCCRIAQHLGVDTVIGVDRVDERLDRARQRGTEVFDLRQFDDEGELVAAVLDRTGGRGPAAVIGAVGMEAHGAPLAAAAHKATALMPRSWSARLMLTAGVDRLAALRTAIELVRRGGTVSIIGVYGGMTDPLPLMTLFDKQVQLRMGQANVRRWVDDVLPLVVDGDPLGTEQFATHRLPLDAAPEAYRTFREKRDGAVKVLFQPASA